MKCSLCGGLVTWRGPLSDLTHAECERCGGRNCQEPEWPEPDGSEAAVDNRTAAEIHGCEVTKFSSRQCVHGTYGCTAPHGVSKS